MDRNVNYLIVGLFVIVGLSAGAAFLYWLSTTAGHRTVERYTVYFRDPINGLAVGGAVRYRGVEVGRVANIRLDPSRPNLIRVDVEIDPATPISGSTRARLKPQGITGLSFIEISTPQADTEPPSRKAGEPYPVIQATGSQLERVIDDLPEVTAQAIALVGRIQTLLSEENIERVSHTIRNLEYLSADLNGLLTAENVALATSSLENLDALTRDLNGLLSEENVANLSRAARLAARSGEELQQVMTRLQHAAASAEWATTKIAQILARNEAAIDQFTGRSLDEIALLLRDSREMIETVRRLADKLDENPSQLIFPSDRKGIVIGQ